MYVDRAYGHPFDCAPAECRYACQPYNVRLPPVCLLKSSCFWLCSPDYSWLLSCRNQRLHPSSCSARAQITSCWWIGAQVETCCWGQADLAHELTLQCKNQLQQAVCCAVSPLLPRDKPCGQRLTLLSCLCSEG